MSTSPTTVGSSPSGLPASLVTKVKKNDTMATEIINPMQVPPPSALAGSQRVMSRDAMGGSPAPMRSNYTELPVPGRKIITKNKLELKSGHEHALLND